MQYTIDEIGKEHNVLLLAPISGKSQQIDEKYLYASSREAVLAITSFDPDVINFNLFGAAFNGQIATMFPESLTTVYDHGGNLFCPYSKQMDIFFTAQKYRRELIIKKNGVSPEKVILNAHGANPKQFYPDDNIEKTYIGIMVGDFRDFKGQKEIIRNWVDVDGKLILVGRTSPPLGDPIYAKECKELIEQLDLSERVKTQDFVSHGELPKIINSAKIGIHMSSHESGSRAITEMMSCGLPMIVFNGCRANVEWVNEGGLKVGLNEIGAAVNYLKNNPAKYKELKEAALKTIKPYTYDRMLSTFKGVIESANA